MISTATRIEDLTLNITQEIHVNASLETTFAALLDQLGPLSETAEGQSMNMKIEAWPGGRWYRDLGNNAGHLWGHVQVIKPPTLLELCGPMFMSFPGINHVQYRLTAVGDVTRLKLTHQAMGPIPEEVREGVGHGWDHGLKRIAEIAGRLKRERR
jgi:hypothetical protein